MPGKKKKNIIPLNIVQKKKKITKEVVTVSIRSTGSGDSRSSSCVHGQQSSGCDQREGSYSGENLGLPSCTKSKEGIVSQEQPQHMPHEARQQKMSEKWQQCVPLAYRALVEEASMRKEICCICGSPGIVRCVQCSSHAFYCIDCGISAHASRNYHHNPELWKVRMCLLIR